MKIRIFSFFIGLFYSQFALSEHNWIRTNPGGGGAIAVVGATIDGTIIAASDLSGIYLSDDNGDSWRVAGWNNNIHETHISSLGFHPTDNDTFIIGTYNGAYKTSDGGVTFALVLAENALIGSYPYIEDIVFSHSNPDIVYITYHSNAASIDGEVYKSIDGGDSWNPVVNENLPANLRILKLLVHPLDSSLIYALTGKSRFSCSPAQLYQSPDGGQNWQRIASGIGDILDVDLDPSNDQILYVSTFVANTCPTDSADFEGFSFEDYVGGDWTSGEVYKSTTGGISFSQIGTETGIINVNNANPQNIKLVNILSMLQYYNDYGNIADNEVGTFSSNNGGSSWSHTGSILNWYKGFRINPWYAFAWSFNGLTKTVTKDEFNSNKMYASFGQWAWSSTDGGNTINNISTKEVSPNYWLSTGMENINGHALEVNQLSPNVVYMGGYDIGFWQSMDTGSSWKQLLPDLQQYESYVWSSFDGSSTTPGRNQNSGSNVATIISDPDRDNMVWASFSEDQYNTPTGLFRSTNFGEGWQLINNGLPVFADSIRMYGLSLDINSPINNRTLYITVAGDVYKSIDDGDSWSMIFANGGLKFTQVDKFDPQLVYAGGENGLFRSTNAGVSWSQIGAQFQTEMQGNLANMRPDIVPTYSEDGAGVKAWQGVFEIQTDSIHAGWVYVTAYGAGKGLYRSKNTGNSWEKLLVDDYMRGVAISSVNEDVIYATASASYHSGASVDSSGIQYSSDGGSSWQHVNDGMAWNYAGTIRISSDEQVWTWSSGTGVQKASTPEADGLFKNGFE